MDVIFLSRVIVSGGYFDDFVGLLTIIEKTEDTLVIISQNEIQHPKPEIAVMGKGITGIALDGDYVWACFSNIIAKIRIENFEIMDVIEDKDFNDLHEIILHKNKLYVANTGFESIDIIDIDSKVIERIDLLGANLRSKRPDYQQNQDSKPHLHHISSITINDEDDIIIGLVRQQRILNLTKWEWMGGKQQSPVHDVEFVDGNIWFTTVGGVISNSEHVWNLADYQPEIGWTRGLAVTDEGIYVGTTAIRESNHDYYSLITNSITRKTEAGICFISTKTEGLSSHINTKNARREKIFSIKKIS